MSNLEKAEPVHMRVMETIDNFALEVRMGFNYEAVDSEEIDKLLDLVASMDVVNPSVN